MSSAFTTTSPDATHRQLLLLEVGDALYGIASDAVREIVASRALTRLPGAPPHVRGLMNLRGELVTVIDLCQRVTGSPARNVDGSTIVVQSGERMLGLSVDDVRDVQPLDVEETADEPLETTSGRLIRRLGRLGDAVVIVLDVDDIVRQTLA
jgi:purine-binding chemotaxis protein CheW